MIKIKGVVLFEESDMRAAFENAYLECAERHANGQPDRAEIAEAPIYTIGEIECTKVELSDG